MGTATAYVMSSMLEESSRLCISPEGAIVTQSACCGACTKPFGRIRRRPKSCQSCGRRFCGKCLEGGRCAGCAIGEQLSGLIAWASNGAAVAFDRDASLRMLAQLSSRPGFREAILPLVRFEMVPRLVSEEVFWDGCFACAA